MLESTRIQIPQTSRTKWAAEGTIDTVFKFKRREKTISKTCFFEMLREVCWFRKKKHRKEALI